MDALARLLLAKLDGDQRGVRVRVVAASASVRALLHHLRLEHYLGLD